MICVCVCVCDMCDVCDTCHMMLLLLQMCHVAPSTFGYLPVPSHVPIPPPLSLPPPPSSFMPAADRYILHPSGLHVQFSLSLSLLQNFSELVRKQGSPKLSVQCTATASCPLFCWCSTPLLKASSSVSSTQCYWLITAAQHCSFWQQTPSSPVTLLPSFQSPLSPHSF